MYLVSSLLFLCAGGAINASMLADVMKEMPPLINENDLHISQVRYPAFLSSSTHYVYLYRSHGWPNLSLLGIVCFLTGMGGLRFLPEIACSGWKLLHFLQL